MRNWKGLMIAVAVDLAWIMARPTATQPPMVPSLDVVADWPADPVAAAPELDELSETGRLIDSLMLYLQDHPHDVAAMETLAGVYAENGWWDAAINPLARALQLDPTRRSLWVMLDRAVEKSGRDKITDAELVRRAAAFKESVEMMGDGC
jgi:cytochrome c-type biogenesis protein CcmH/NrfG